MTPQETAKAKAEVMVAFADGKTIQSTRCSDKEINWEDQPSPLWDWIRFEYRIKPAEHRKAKLSAFVSKYGQLIHYDMMKIKTLNSDWNSDWTRVPSLDLEYEVTE